VNPATRTPQAPSASSPAGGDRLADDSFLSVGPNLFKATMRHHAKGVAVITAGVERPVGFCATSLASVSLDPPLVSFTVGRGTTSWATMETARHVMVHLLASGQEDIARGFASPGGAKFGPGIGWQRGAFGLPTLDDALAWLVLTPICRLPVGDHSLIVGRVIAARHDPGGEPLVHHNGEFVRLAAPAGSRAVG
jgi:flavin reductase (DIM6/NTAB) family NADH-FMN oxidoreductase RutF